MEQQELLDLASNPETTAKQLGAVVGQYPSVDVLIANHPNALLWVFEDLANTGNLQTIQALLGNPDLPPELVRDIGNKYPPLLAQSPVLDRFITDIPDLLNEIASILEVPECPKALIRAAIETGNGTQKHSVLRNPALSELEKTELSPNRLHLGAVARIKKLADEQENPAIKKSIELYAATSRTYCMPRFLPFERNNRAHRLADQTTGGFPFTSASWPWPQNDWGKHMHFLAQVDLDNASRVLGFDCGSGLLQVWAPIPDDYEGYVVRVVPRSDLDQPLETAYPDESETTALEHGLFHWKSVAPLQPRIEWTNLGEMFYRDFWTLVSDLGVKVTGLNPDDVEDELLTLSEDITELCIPHAALTEYFVQTPRLFLGGYPFGYGNGWDHFHQPRTRMLLNMMSQGDPLFHLGISVGMNANGEIEYELDVACTN